MHRVQGILAHEAVDLVEVAEGAAHADHLCVRVDLREPFDLLELFGEELFDLARLLLGRDAVVGEEVGERHRAEGERRIVEHRPAVVIDDLGAAAADLQDDPLGDVHRVDDAAVDERRLLLFGEHFDADAARRLDLVQKGALIFGAADRRRGDGDDARDAARVTQAFEHFERLVCLGDPLRLQKAVPVHILTEADALFEFVLDHKVIAAEQADDDKARGIGTEVDDPDLFRCLLFCLECRAFHFVPVLCVRFRTPSSDRANDGAGLFPSSSRYRPYSTYPLHFNTGTGFCPYPLEKYFIRIYA